MQIAVVGAGPAGSLCALRLARAGHRVILFDPAHPREKPCGGGFTPGAFRRHTELEGPRELGRPATHVRLRGPRGEPVRVALPAPILVFARERLDGALVERAVGAGAELRAERGATWRWIAAAWSSPRTEAGCASTSWWAPTARRASCAGVSSGRSPAARELGHRRLSREGDRGARALRGVLPGPARLPGSFRARITRRWGSRRPCATRAAPSSGRASSRC